MKTFIAICLIIVISLIVLLNIHIIRTDKKIEFATKEHMTFRDTYADVRQWTLEDYFVHSPRIRNYLFYEIHYDSLSKKVEKTQKDLKKKTDKAIDTAKEKLSNTEKAVHEWLSEQLEE